MRVGNGQVVTGLLIVRLSLPQALLIGYAALMVAVWAVIVVLGVRARREGAGR